MAVKKTITRSQEFSDSVIDTVREPLIILDQDLRVVNASRSFYKFFKVVPEETVGQLIYNLGNKQWDIPKLRELLETILPEKTTFDDYEVEHDFTAIGKRIMLLNARQIQRESGKERIILLAIEDITERKQLEELLADSEERYRRLFETASDGIVLLEKREGKITHTNPATEKMLGYNKKESIGHKLQDIGIALDRGDFQTTMQNLNKIGILNYDDVPVTTKLGQHIDTDIYLVDRARLVQCNIRDITERKKTTELLRESEEKYRLSFENVTDVIYVIDTNLNILSVSPSVERILGYKPQDLIGRSAADLSHVFTPKSFEQAITDISLILKGETITAQNYRFIAKDGSIKIGEVSGSPVMRDDKIIGLISVARDITDRKQAEEKLRESEEKYRWVLDNMADVITIMDMNLRFTYVSPSIMRMRGYTAEEAMAQTFEQVMTPESLQINAEVFEEEMKLEAGGMADPDRIRIVEAEQYRKDGSIVLMENHLSFMRDEAKKPVGIISVSHDITQRKEAEEALIKAKTLLDKTFASMEEAIFIVDSNTRRIIACNQATEVIFGFGEKDLIGCTTDVLHVDKLSYNLFGQKLFPALDANGVFHTEFQMRRKDGSVFPTENTVTEILDDLGHRTSVVSVVRDITDRRMAEKKLKQTNIFLDSIIENIPDMVFLKDARDLRFIRLNRAGEDLLGYSRDDLLGKSDYDLFPKEQADSFTQEDRNVLYGKELVDIVEEFIQTRTKGERIIHTKKVPILNEDGETAYLLGISEDITERKRDEKALRKAEETYRLVVDNMVDVITVLDLNLRFTYVSPSIIRLRGYTAEEVMEQTFEQVMTPESLQIVTRVFEEELKLEASGTADPDRTRILELEEYKKDGSTVWLENRLSSFRDKENKLAGIISLSHDITERKKAEETLKESEKKYRLLADNVNDVIFVLDMNLNFTYVSPSTKILRGYEPEESMKLSLTETLAPSSMELAMKTISDIMELEKIKKIKINESRMIPLEVKRKDGTTVWTEVKLSFIRDENRQPVGILGVTRDITQRRKAEAELLRTLESLKKAVGTTIQVLISALEARDPYTAGHQFRVAHLACAIATEMGLSQEKIDGIQMAGSIHDIGKLSIPAEILSKPAKLTNLEFSMIKEHSQSGYEMLKDVDSTWPLAQIVYQHHERMNGSGYPRNLKGDEILMEARIMTVADVVEAMASHRPYRPSLGIDIALEEIEKNKGILYDATVVDACLRLFREKSYKLIIGK